MKISATIDCISGADECVSSRVSGARQAEPSGISESSSRARLATIAMPAQRRPLISFGCSASIVGRPAGSPSTGEFLFSRGSITLSVRNQPTRITRKVEAVVK